VGGCSEGQAIERTRSRLRRGPCTIIVHMLRARTRVFALMMIVLVRVIHGSEIVEKFIGKTVRAPIAVEVSHAALSQELRNVTQDYLMVSAATAR
jgi:hypothetical protein